MNDLREVRVALDRRIAELETVKTQLSTAHEMILDFHDVGETTGKLQFAKDSLRECGADLVEFSLALEPVIKEVNESHD